MSLSFTREQLTLLSSARLNTPTAQRRVEALLLLTQGYQASIIAQRLQVSPKSVYKWFHAFQHHGLQGLAENSSAMQLNNLDNEYRTCLYTTLALPTQRWSIERLQEHLYQQTGIRLSEARLRKVLGDLGYAYRRVECWKEGELTFVGSTWVQAPADQGLVGQVLVYGLEKDGSVTVSERNDS